MREVLVLGNTIVAAGHGIALRSGDASHLQRVAGNAVFASPAILGAAGTGNVVAARAEAVRHLTNPLSTPPDRDFRPRPGALAGTPPDVRDFAGLADRDRDFDGRPRDWAVAGAYGGPAAHPAWLPKVELKP